MKRLVSLIAGLAYLCAAQAAWAGGFGGLLNPFWGGGLTFLQCTSDNSNATTYTFSATNVGTASADRLTVIGIMAEDALEGYTVDTVTVAGDSATEVVENDTVSVVTKAAIYQLSNSSGTSEDIVVTFSEAILGATICVWSITGLTSSTATGSDSDFTGGGNSIDLTVNVTAGGALVAVCAGQVDTESFTWTGANEQTDAASGSGEHRQSSADTKIGSTDAAYAVSCDITGSNNAAGAAAAWK